MGSGFPATRWSAIVAVRSADPAERGRALEALFAAYWKPVYKYIRLRWSRSNEDAKDLTQGFFAELLERNLLSRYDPAKGRLRTYLRLCVDSFVANTDKAARRLKRGGDAVHVGMDFDAAEDELSHAAMDPARLASPESLEDFFEREWIRSLFGSAVEDLRQECGARNKTVHFRLFEQYDLEDSAGPQPGYDDLAGQYGLAVTDVTNYLAWARREFRRVVLERLRELCGGEEEFRREARALFGWQPK
jgi:RNA polymerase sigma factor (sigma-70 family)